MSPFENLKNILTEEKKRGYDNSVVIGGIDSLANGWAPRAVTQVDSLEERLLVEKIAGQLRRYSSLDEQGRTELVDELLNEIENRPRPQVDSASPAPPVSDRQSTDQAAPPAPEPDSAQPTAPASRRAGKAPDTDQVSPQTSKAALEALDANVTQLLGIKKAYAERLQNLGIETIGDLLSHYPRRYIDYRKLKNINQLEYGEVVTILGTVWECHARDTRRGLKIINCTLSDQTATIQVTWFNQPWLVNKLKPGTLISVSGKVDQYLGRLVFQSPEWEIISKRQISTGRLTPVYPLTEGVTQQWMRSQINRVVERWAARVPDHIPAQTLETLGMPRLGRALAQIHFPDDPDSLEEARRRLAFDELLFIQLGVLRQRRAWRSVSGRPVSGNPDLLQKFVETLPYQLTSDQHKVLQDISGDLSQNVPMNRLLQGDVGSGKTVVALAAMILTAADGGQSAMMAPTEILAEQHFRSMSALLDRFRAADPSFDFPIHLLTGSTPVADREAIYQDIASGKVGIIVGTHALIQDPVEFNDLRLVIIDEQHRFGVQQRSLLRSKGYNPHMLVMSATPIPRSLALTLYGDLDLSVIREMPPGRQEIKTTWMSPSERERAYGFIRSQIEQGHQAFIICPLVEESDKIEAKSAVEEHARLAKEIYPDLRIGLVHGRMKSEEKDAAMNLFHQGQLDILVATAVVEVGIDVPNATVMLIEGANRFGLAQLHQFRGRVGRGEAQSYCLLLADATTTDAEARLQVISQTNDGFQLAEEDLKLRGPGEFFGTRQSGLPDIKVATISDGELLELARNQAIKIFEQDPELSGPEHEILGQKLAQFWQVNTDLS